MKRRIPSPAAATLSRCARPSVLNSAVLCRILSSLPLPSHSLFLTALPFSLVLSRALLAVGGDGWRDFCCVGSCATLALPFCLCLSLRPFALSFLGSLYALHAFCSWKRRIVTHLPIDRIQPKLLLSVVCGLFVGCLWVRDGICVCARATCRLTQWRGVSKTAWGIWEATEQGEPGGGRFWEGRPVGVPAAGQVPRAHQRPGRNQRRAEPAHDPLSH